MTRLLSAYAAVALVMLAIDLVWLGAVAKPLYLQGIGHLMLEQPNLPAAVAFYVVYALGLMVFAVVPAARTRGWGSALWRGALFGFFAYATYDLTNLATLKGWPVWLAALDIGWGSLVSAVSAAAGKALLGRAGTG